VDGQCGLHPWAEFVRQAGTLTLPKGTFTVLPPDRWYLPIVAFSYGMGFTPKIQIGKRHGNADATGAFARVPIGMSKVLKQTQFYLTLRRTSNSRNLLRSIPTLDYRKLWGLQSTRCSPFPRREILVLALFTFPTRRPMPAILRPANPSEAPRFIWDTVGSRLTPAAPAGRAEYDMCAPSRWRWLRRCTVNEFRGAVLRPFWKTACRSPPTSLSPTVTPARRPSKSPFHPTPFRSSEP